MYTDLLYLSGTACVFLLNGLLWLPYFHRLLFFLGLWRSLLYHGVSLWRPLLYHGVSLCRSLLYHGFRFLQWFQRRFRPNYSHDCG